MRYCAYLLLGLFASCVLYAQAPDGETPPPEETEPYETAQAAAPAPEHFSELVYISLNITNDNTPLLYFQDGLPAFGFGEGPDDAFTLGIRLEFDWLKPLWVFDRIKVIQNAFHYIINYFQYSTPYLDPSYYKASPLVGLKARFGLELFEAIGFTVAWALYARGLWDMLCAGRSSLWMGAELQATSSMIRLCLSGGYRMSDTGGDALLAPMFGGGIFFLTRMCVRLGDFNIGFGIALDAYGNAPVAAKGSELYDNRHFFFSFSYGDASRADPLDNFSRRKSATVISGKKGATEKEAERIKKRWFKRRFPRTRVYPRVRGRR